MSHSQSLLTKYISPQMIASSFTGMVMALPLVFTLSSSATRVNEYQTQPAVQNQSTAQVSDADFARFAYAYDKGYQAHVANVSTANVTTPGTCSDPSGPSAGPEMSGSGAYMPSAPVAKMTTYKTPTVKHAPLAAVVNSYNSYASTINNSSSVTNTNSNNTAGSNNLTMTSIDAHELKGMVMIDNSQTTTQVSAVDSFNKDSYNTKTDTTTINDSFNKQVAINSGNTSTDTTNITNNVTKTSNSNNTTNTTENSNNTTDTTQTTNTTENSNNTTQTTNSLDVTNTENKTIDSYNTNIDVNLEHGQQGGPHNV